jgi:hypothetical protein
MILGDLLGAGNFSRSTSSQRRRGSSEDKSIVGVLSPLALSVPMRGVIVKTWLGSKCNRMLNLKMCSYPQHVTLIDKRLWCHPSSMLYMDLRLLFERIDKVALV